MKGIFPKMPYKKTVNDTPVRHDELSIAKNGTRSRKMISSTKDVKKNNVPLRRLLKNANTNYIEKCQLDKPNPNMTEGEECEERGDETSIPIKLCGNMNMIREKENFIQERKHSTPMVLKFPVKALSSTPNQDLLNNSILTCNATTQTDFTLNGRVFEDFSESLKSCCTEELDENSVLFEHCTQSYFENNSFIMSSSSLRNTCKHKEPLHKTPHRKKPSMRKLSLRSKTMISSAIENSQDKPNTLKKYKSLEERRMVSNTFSILPQSKTPQSDSAIAINNPFEEDLEQKLGKSLFSPDVFETVVSPSEESSYLRWTIEDVSSINPVAIDEDFTLPSEEDDPEKESLVQQEIDRYFSETHFIESPDDVPKAKFGLNNMAAASTPQKMDTEIFKDLKNATTQTLLTLPEHLPDDLEESLKSYFKVFENDDLSFNASSLRRKLFFHSEDEPPSPVKFETFSSPISSSEWQIQHSPFPEYKNGRHFTPLGHQKDLSSPDISPVVSVYTSQKFKNDSLSLCKKTLHLYFSGDDSCTTDSKHSAEDEPMVNSTLCDKAEADCSSMLPASQDTGYSSSVLPASQETGYHTEESWR